jgi:hypothetical protein
MRWKIKTGISRFFVGRIILRHRRRKFNDYEEWFIHVTSLPIRNDIVVD